MRSVFNKQILCENACLAHIKAASFRRFWVSGHPMESRILREKAFTVFKENRRHACQKTQPLGLGFAIVCGHLCISENNFSLTQNVACEHRRPPRNARTKRGDGGRIRQRKIGAWLQVCCIVSPVAKSDAQLDKALLKLIYETNSAVAECGQSVNDGFVSLHAGGNIDYCRSANGGDAAYQCLVLVKPSQHCKIAPGPDGSIGPMLLPSCSDVPFDNERHEPQQHRAPGNRCRHSPPSIHRAPHV